MAAQQKRPSNLILQLVLNFVLPLFVLTRLSTGSALDPTRSLMLALSFPIIYEFYNIIKNKTLSLISIFSIGGIILTASISLLELSVGWLAARRSATYIIFMTGILLADKLGYPMVDKFMSQIFNMQKLKKSLKGDEKALKKIFKKHTYMVALLFGGIALINYILTLISISSPLNTPEFNQQYASLRIKSIFFITLPLLMGIIIILWQVISSLEKLTGKDIANYLKK